MSDEVREEVKEETDEVVDETPEEEQVEEPEKKVDIEKLAEQIENLNKALKEERETKKMLKAQLEQYQMLIEQQSKKEEPEEEIEINDDDYLTYAEFKKIYEMQKRKEEEERKRLIKQQQEFNVRLVEAEDVFRQSHPDYDDTVKILQNVLREDKELASYLMSDPLKAPERAYKIAKAFKASSDKKMEAKEEVELLKKQPKKPATQGVRGSSVMSKASEKEAAEMTLQEYEEYIKNLSPEDREKITGIR